ncbi:MAG: serine/threonine protein phosphatase [Leptolyngbya foveolarum]|uniref:Serine/threonine protein phosphatase n=1 Tax=Leptolyngbya foveolarum TaxID=47253 RepID=A0A2W4UD49_9CYAN|nr:MAG: serine/threonine protein phosphatase [Leptolyngbya foveolarum]
MNGEDKYPFRQYVWALGHGTNKIPVGDLVDDRYQVIAPSIWLDQQPEQMPKVPSPVPQFALPYLKAYPYQLNLPGVYGICHQSSGEAVLLLSNVPVNRQGQLMSAIAQVWSEASAFRQAYWLWQMISLWEPMQEFGAAASLLKNSNIRVEAWRVRLIGLSTTPSKPSLADLSKVWESTYLPSARPAIVGLLNSVCLKLRAEAPDLQAIIEQINAQLLREAAGTPIDFQVAGATDAGPQKSRNEDACYPSKAELKRTGTADLPLLPRLSIVCDGVGGHEGGEVASQSVVRFLQLQLRGLLAEAMEQPQAIPPRVVIDQIEAAVRVANNLIADQNDQQGRAARQRMGTTLVMALVLPQKIDTAEGPAEVNELYLTHVGDSRAYWMTSDYCQQLTVDDDIAGREVSAGTSFYATAMQNPNATALSQAVGLRSYDQLRPHTQRFLFDTSGVLMLCSDGLSDNYQVEASWANYVGIIVKKIVPLDAAVDSWIELANQRNGHDNVTVTLMSVDMAEDGAIPEETDQPSRGLGAIPLPPSSSVGQFRPDNIQPEQMTAASRALLYGEAEEDETPLTPEEMAEVDPGDSEGRSGGQKLVTILLGLLALGIIGVGGWLLWRALEARRSEPLLPTPEQVETPTDGVDNTADESPAEAEPVETAPEPETPVNAAPADDPTAAPANSPTAEPTEAPASTPAEPPAETPIAPPASPPGN